MRPKKPSILSVLVYIFTFMWLLQGLVLFYRACVSPLLASVCIYRPSCSYYMLVSLRRFGPIKGVFLGTKRLLRCQPWARGGLDPVPIKKSDYRWLY